MYVTWDYIDLEQSSSCSYDYIEIYHSYNEQTHQGHYVGRYCGTDTPPSVWLQSPLYIVFRTDQSITSNGFSMFWLSGKVLMIKKTEHNTMYHNL